MAKRDAHATGSGITYAKRYQLCAALGVFTCDEDDDGAKAQLNAPKATIAHQPIYATVNKAEWVEKWSKKYDTKVILEYIEARAKHLKHDVSLTVSQLASNESLFEKNILIWIDNKKKEEEEDGEPDSE